ncbi:paraslipin [Oceanispirochaeta crateris]|uniref:Protein QmcA n=1 Tax=Oceanispirochaeta crateris TaxID=2518645 RepID=A0A5C1QN59_9SPIO|nr:stomatin-like protein [Oceanispirochaeta crateris]QEN07612.1 paraslipin [Oceanispirochaeta crateris]
MNSSWLLIAVLLFLLILLIKNIRIVPQANAFILERLGAYQTTWEVGLHVKIPLVDRVSNKVSMKENVIDFDPQPVITKDNVTMQIDTVVYYQITDAKLFTYGVDRPISAIENLTATTLRNIIGDLELDETLTSRDVINTKMRSILDEATDPWGIKVNRVEVKNILPPADIQEAMEKQMRAERGRREAILRAEGEKMSAILMAEGVKQSTILKAEADKESAILQADANRERSIREADGEAEAILKVQEATAKGLTMIKDAHVDAAVIQLRSLDALAKVANGQATKIIIPSEIQNLAGLAASLKEISQ